MSALPESAAGGGVEKIAQNSFKRGLQPALFFCRHERHYGKHLGTLSQDMLVAEALFLFDDVYLAHS